MANQQSSESSSNTYQTLVPELEAQIINRAATDSAFRDRLISEPKTVMTEMGLVVPDDVNINVLTETPTEYYLILPGELLPQLRSDLSDTELEAIAGGGCDTVNGNWTGCDSGQSGCIATEGCSTALSGTPGGATVVTVVTVK